MKGFIVVLSVGIFLGAFLGVTLDVSAGSILGFDDSPYPGIGYPTLPPEGYPGPVVTPTYPAAPPANSPTPTPVDCSVPTKDPACSEPILYEMSSSANTTSSIHTEEELTDNRPEYSPVANPLSKIIAWIKLFAKKGTR